MMRNAIHETLSAWFGDNPMIPVFPALDQNVKADVCVVGAGIGGMTAAYLLSQEGLSVIVVEKEQIGMGQTGRTTAHLSTALDDRYFNIERYHGLRGARLAAGSHAAGIDQIEAIVNEELIDCQFERLNGYLFLPPGQSPEILRKELASSHRAGLVETKLLENSPLKCFDTGPCLRFLGQAQFHPLKYLLGLTQGFLRRGGKIYGGTSIQKIQGGPQTFAQTETGVKISAGSIIVATNTPINDRLVMHTKQAAYRTYAIAATIPRGSVPKALYWDTEDPYHYIRICEGPGMSDLLIVGGEDHKTGQDHSQENRFDALENWTRDRFPMIEKVDYRWSGQVMEPVDALAFLGNNPADANNVYIITGDSGQGMTHCTIGGMLIRDLITGRPNAWVKLYDPSRKTLEAVGEYIRENANTAAQYADWLTAGEVSHTEDIAPGKGAILRAGLKKIAVYKDEDGEVRRLSAACTHLEGIVAWNDVEKTWDCPCHGSRFDVDGKVLSGPAVTPLQPVDEIHEPSYRQRESGLELHP